MFEFLVLLLLFGSLSVTSFLAGLGGIGVICAPFAAYLTYRRASQHGFDPVRYAFIGALYSMLLVLPWFLLLGKLSGRYPSTGWALSMLYFFWLFGPITFTFFNVEILDEGGFVDPLLILISGCLMVFAWVGSLIWQRVLKERNSWAVHHPMGLRERLLASRRMQHEGQMPEHGYIVPFVCATISFLVALGLIRI